MPILSADDTQPLAQRPALERHLQTIFGALGLATLLWVGGSLIDLGKEQVRTTEQLSQMKATVGNLQDQVMRATGDRYTAGDAKRDSAAIEIRIQAIESRLARFERESRR